jgi:hypothetical protein
MNVWTLKYYTTLSTYFFFCLGFKVIHRKDDLNALDLTSAKGKTWQKVSRRKREREREL